MKNKIERYLLLLLILLLPTQLGHYFFGDFSFIDGFRVDYLAPFLGLFDCVFLVLFVFKLIKLMQPKKLKRISFYLVCIFQAVDIMPRRNDSGQAGMTIKFAKQLAMGIAGAILLIIWQLFISSSDIVMFYRFARYIQVILLFFWFKNTKLQPSQIISMVLLGAGFELILTIWQVKIGASVGGLWYFLGERYILSTHPAVAKVVYGTTELLRGYGTFSHPNSLAGFYLMWYLYLQKVPFPKGERYPIIIEICKIFCVFLVLLSFSKVAIFLLLFCYLSEGLKNYNCIFCKITKLLVVFSVGFFYFLGIHDNAGIQKRVEFMFNALELVVKYPLGVGFGNYLIALQKLQIPSKFHDIFNQPVHNIFLLFLSETGFIGLIGVVIILKKYSQLLLIQVKKNWMIFFAIFLIGISDHYLLTLPQNLAQMGIILGLIRKA